MLEIIKCKTAQDSTAGKFSPYNELHLEFPEDEDELKSPVTFCSDVTGVDFFPIGVLGLRMCLARV